MNDTKMNHGAIWISIVLLDGFGFLWFGPLFGTTWMEMEGVTEADAGNASIATWIANTVSTIISVYTLAWLFTKIGVDSLTRGLFIGIVVGFGFAVVPQISGDMFGMNPYGLAWISGGYTMATLGLTGAILGFWVKK